ncbi:DNA modification methylase [Thermoplasmatales archaeon BRNA1]|nr:DNA modification methylase [Thermoplasmatales archaeon BRNA1]
MNFKKGSTKIAREIANSWLEEYFPEIHTKLKIGLPEYNDRTDNWHVSIMIKNNSENIGEIRIDSGLTKVVETTELTLIKERIAKNKDAAPKKRSSKKEIFKPVPMGNKIILGDSCKVLEDYPPNSVQLVFTSPPYYNAKPEYSEYVDYQEYLDALRKVIVRCRDILSEGRFFIINISPVLIKRTSRNTSSKRIPIPFDINTIMVNNGFEFIDDIIWEKPEGAGWNVGRGRRFKADRNPLQYKPVPVTEYVLVYRKSTDKLIDWNIRNHYDQQAVKDSKILGEYDVTNIWKIKPSNNKLHPATFPEELCRRVIRYYSFIGDMVLDPFAGTGTVAKVAHEMGRRFMVIDKERSYYDYMKDTVLKELDENTDVECYAYEEVN